MMGLWLPIYFLTIFLTLGKNDDDRPPFKFKKAPPGTVWLKDSLYIDVEPVTNAAYRDFLRFIETGYSPKTKDTLYKIPSYGVDLQGIFKYMKKVGVDKTYLKQMTPPREVRLSWKMQLSDYFENPLYDRFPVVFVTYKMAKEFCEWRTLITMLNYASLSKNPKQRSKYYTKIRYRLPTVDEMTYALTKFKDNIYANYKIFADIETFTMPAYPQKKKKLEFVYFPRNVAEYTTQENVAFGLSWFDRDTTETYIKTVTYSRPSDWLGFRCVCEIVKY